MNNTSMILDLVWAIIVIIGICITAFTEKHDSMDFYIALMFWYFGTRYLSTTWNK